MFIINQPFNGLLGDTLITEMSNAYEELFIVSAFAQNSGVLHLKSSFEDFRKRGGTITAIIGLDLHGTSEEALRSLLVLTDNLYVIHDSKQDRIFHSKIYMLRGTTNIWIAVGSNNLTAGGLWKNIESSLCITLSKGSKEYNEIFSLMSAMIDRLTSTSEPYVRKLNKGKDIDELVAHGYVKSAIVTQLERQKQKSALPKPPKSGSLFGTIPDALSSKFPKGRHPEPKGTTQTPESALPTPVVFSSLPANTGETLWFETKSMTGGSRNILDLSKTGTITMGSATGTRFKTSHPQTLMGGVFFFDIDPSDIAIEKEVTINYNGSDYYPCTIKYALNNGSWRIQLKGVDARRNKLQSAVGANGFVKKIIVLERIRAEYYAAYIFDDALLPDFEANSLVVARNGTSKASKKYGILVAEENIT